MVHSSSQGFGRSLLPLLIVCSAFGLSSRSYAQCDTTPPPVPQATPQIYPPWPSVTVAPPGGGGNYTTITAAVSAVASGTQIRVKAGTYLERGIDFGNKELILTSVDGRGAAIIDANLPAPGVPIFKITQSQTAASVINGFMMKNGRNARGGAIQCKNASPTIINNIFLDNSAAFGGAIYVENGSPKIAGNEFDHNGYGQASAHPPGPDAAEGGAVFLFNSSSLVKDNEVINNRSTIGGGIAVDGASYVTLTHNTLQGNFANDPASSPLISPKGGAISITTGVAVIATCNEIIDNTATESGGGVWFWQGSALTRFEGNTFTGNLAEQFDGGGLFCEGATGTFVGNTFEANQCDGYGGGIYCAGAQTSEFTSNAITGNAAWFGGGGIACNGDANVKIIGCDITNNDTKAQPPVGGKGAGIYVEASSVTIQRNRILGNGRNNSMLGFPCMRGGGIDYAGGILGHIEANQILFNGVTAGQAATANGYGAGVALKNLGPGSSFSSNIVAKNDATTNASNTFCYGAGVLIEQSNSFRVYNNTIAYNTNGTLGHFGVGGGLLFSGVTQQFTVTNSIVWGNLAQHVFLQTDQVIHSMSIVSGVAVPIVSYSNVSSPPNAGGWMSGPNMYSLDPLFVNPSLDDYHIQGTSFMIDRGNDASVSPPDIDVDGAPRIIGVHVDIGADEI